MAEKYFSTEMREAMTPGTRNYTLVAEIFLPTGPAMQFAVRSPGFQKAVAENIAYAAATVDASSLGRFLHAQDFDYYGDAQMATTMEVANEAPGALEYAAYDTLTAMFADHDPHNLEVVFYLSYWGAGIPTIAREELARFIVDDVRVVGTRVRFSLLEMRRWNRRAPFTTIDKTTLGSEFRTPITEGVAEVMPVHYGVRGLGGYAAQNDPWLNAKPELFAGRARPVNPAAAVLISTRINELVFGIQDGGFAQLNYNYWQDLFYHNVFLDVGDGKFASLGQMTNNPADPIYFENRTVPLLSSFGSPRGVQVIVFNHDADLTAQLPVFPATDYSSSAEWGTQLLDGDASDMWGDDLWTAVRLRMDSGVAGYASSTWNLGMEQKDHGPIKGFEAWAYVDLPSGIRNITVEAALAFYGAEYQVSKVVTQGGLVTFNMDSLIFDTSIALVDRDRMYTWSFSYDASGGGDPWFEPVKLRLGFKYQSGASPFDIGVRGAGLGVKFFPDIVDTEWRYRRGPNYPIGALERFRVATYFDVAQPPASSIFISGTATKDASPLGMFTGQGAPGWLITHPIGQIWNYLRSFGHSGSYTCPVPATPVLQEEYGGFIFAMESMNGVLERLVPGAVDGWKSAASMLRKEKSWDTALRFFRHLPFMMYRGRQGGQMNCVVWWPEPLPGESDLFPNEYWYQAGPINQLTQLYPITPPMVKNVIAGPYCTPTEQIFNEIIIDWEAKSGDASYGRRAICGPGVWDDGHGEDIDDLLHGGAHKELALLSEERFGTRTLPIQAPTVYRTHEVNALLAHYLRKHAKKHIRVMLELDILMADMELYKIVHFDQSIQKEKFHDVPVPWLEQDWWEPRFRVIQRSLDLDAESVIVELESVRGIDP